MLQQYCAEDLGVIMDENLTFVPHFEFVCKNTSKSLGFMIVDTADLKA